MQAPEKGGGFGLGDVELLQEVAGHAALVMGSLERGRHKEDHLVHTQRLTALWHAFLKVRPLKEGRPGSASLKIWVFESPSPDCARLSGPPPTLTCAWCQCLHFSSNVPV